MQILTEVRFYKVLESLLQKKHKKKMSQNLNQFARYAIFGHVRFGIPKQLSYFKLGISE